MSAKEQSKNGKKKQTWIIVVSIVFVLLCVVAKGYSIFSNARYDNIQEEKQEVLKYAFVPVQSAMVNYMANHNGESPVDSRWVGSRSLECATTRTGYTADCFVKNYINSASSTYNTFIDSSGEYYNLRIMTLSGGEEKVLDTSDHTVYMVKNAICEERKAIYENDKAIYSSNKRDYVLMYYLETGKTYCLNK